MSVATAAAVVGAKLPVGGALAAASSAPAISSVGLASKLSVYTWKRYAMWLLLLGGCGVGATAGLVLLYRRVQRRRTAIEAVRTEHLHSQSVSNQQQNVWDVVVVGAGPAGATCAYYCAKDGLRVLLLERDRFPRDKICGDQVHTQAQLLLSDMGVMQQLVAVDSVRWVRSTTQNSTQTFAQEACNRRLTAV